MNFIKIRFMGVDSRFSTCMLAFTRLLLTTSKVMTSLLNLDGFGLESPGLVKYLITCHCLTRSNLILICVTSNFMLTDIDAI